jgi:hypothetical protein
MRRFQCIALVCLVVLAFWDAADAYQVTSSHPRLYLTAADLPALRARCAGAMSSDYGDLRSWCDSNMSASLPMASADAYEWHLTAMSFAYLVSSESAYATRARTIAMSGISQGLSNQRPFMRALSFYYDWCYPALSSSDRQTVGSAIASGGLDYMASNNWEQMTNYHSKLSRLMELACTGLAIYGDGVADASAVQLCDTFRYHMYDSKHALACLDEIGADGAYYEGAYTTSVVGMGFREAAWVWAVATNEDPFETSSHLRNMATYYLYETFARRSTSLGGSKQGDTESHTIATASVRVILQNLASRYRDGRAKWLAEQIEAQGLGYINRPERWRLLIFEDPSLAAQSPVGLPTSRFFDSMGIVYMRSGWDLSESSTDVYAVFRCETMPAGHTNAHQNHLLIARGGDVLAIDSGTYDGGTSAHHNNYFERTIAHNTVTVYNPGETTFGSLANDGGQIPVNSYDYPVHYGDATSPESFRGEIVAYSDSESYAYMKGDATAAYAASKVELFTREIVYLKPDVFVVLDRVRATSPSFTKRWLLHSFNEPAVSGNTATITEGDSRLSVTSLLPPAASIGKVGGSGHEFDVNGTNYPPSGGWEKEMGAWRVEITPQTGATEHVFLTVLQVGAASAQPDDVTLVQGEEMLGARIGSNVVMFSASGASVESETYEY